MAKAQRDENRYAVMSYVPLELVAKIKSFIEGKEVPNKARKGQTVHKLMRPMAMSDALIMFADKALARQKVSPAAEKWAAKTLRRNKKDRKIADREYAEAVALEQKAEEAKCRGE